MGFSAPPVPDTPEGTPPAPNPVKAARWEALVRGGISPDRATAQVQREFDRADQWEALVRGGLSPDSATARLQGMPGSATLAPLMLGTPDVGQPAIGSRPLVDPRLLAAGIRAPTLVERAQDLAASPAMAGVTALAPALTSTSVPRIGNALATGATALAAPFTGAATLAQRAGRTLMGSPVTTPTLGERLQGSLQAQMGGNPSAPGGTVGTLGGSLLPWLAGEGLVNPMVEGLGLEGRAAPMANRILRGTGAGALVGGFSNPNAPLAGAEEGAKAGGGLTAGGELVGPTLAAGGRAVQAAVEALPSLPTALTAFPGRVMAATAPARRAVARILSPEMREAAEVDPLTEVGNLNAYLQALPRTEADPGLAVVKGDLINLKARNELPANTTTPAGHHVGDAYIQQGTATAQQAVQDVLGVRPDQAARYVFHPHGDEINLAGLPAEQAPAVAARWQALMGTPDHAGYPGGVRVGVGGTDAEAEAAMQAAARAETGPKFRTLEPPPEPPAEPTGGQPAPLPPTPPGTAPDAAASREYWTAEVARRENIAAQVRKDSTSPTEVDRADANVDYARQQLAAGTPAIPTTAPAAATATATLPDAGSITPTTVRGRPKWVGGDPKYATTADEALVARHSELLDRLNAESQHASPTPFARFDPNADMVRAGEVWSNRAGRAVGAVKRDARLLDEVRAELVGRGYTPSGADILDRSGNVFGRGDAYEEDVTHQPLTGAGLFGLDESGAAGETAPLSPAEEN